ncbi:MAG: nitroreductase family protein [Kiritimatiellae bacterium]|nr:nitroreductase family protein [Kiritimatiellia bacterium]
MDFTEVVKTRRSVRSYRSDPIPEDVLRRVLDGARMAPSANNIQPWHFLVVKDAAKRRQLAELAAGQMFVAEAPVVIVCCGRRYEDRYSWIRSNMYLVDCSIAIDHLTLAARNEGLGTCWIGAFDHDGVRKAVQVPSGYDVIMLLPIGYPASKTAFRETGGRRGLREIVSQGNPGPALK